MDCNLDDIAKEFLDGLDPLPFCSDLLGDGSLGLSALQQNSADPQPGGPRWSSFCQVEYALRCRCRTDPRRRSRSDGGLILL